ncbi:acyltransferase family protein [Sphingomonas sp. 3-13AW]|uniref:acyltransferase family protein n=1 Tax=Sphingomonas sp. 3-13AW TaxID=3050450 RepID=UPI003BB7005F
MADPDRRPQLTLLQAGRGVAALLVVLYHLGGSIIGDPKFWNVEVDGGLFRFGHEGVAFFFVLSGFIILHAHLADLGRPERLGEYLFKRATRIYLPYWVVLFPLIAIYGAVPTLGRPEISAPAVMLNSPLLVGATSHATLAVAWTLFHEVAFYALFAVTVLDRRAGVLLLTLWQLACLASLALPAAPHYALHPINLLFGMGMAARLLMAGPVPAPRAIMAAGIALFVTLGLLLNYTRLIDSHTSSLLFGAASFLFVLGGVAAESRGLIAAPVALTRLGDASYSLYLVHFPVLSLLARMLRTGPLSATPAPVAYVLLAGGAIAAGLAFHHAVERPLLRLVTRLVRRRRAPALTQP